MEFLVRFSQLHETFRLAELHALAVVEHVEIRVLSYSPDSPFCIITAPSANDAAKLVRRAILIQAIYEYWGSGVTLEELKQSIIATSSHLWPEYSNVSFKFGFDSFQGARLRAAQVELMRYLAFIPLNGPIKLSNPEQQFRLFEEWEFQSVVRGIPDPLRYYLGRFVGKGSRELTLKFDLKKRRYISTTSMDSELALVTANIALAAPGKLFYDPFVGTGSFPIACGQFGAMSWGSDIDGRAARGEDGNFQRKDDNKTLKGNFEQYGLVSLMGDVFTADLTNSPMRRFPVGTAGDGGKKRLFDGIVCDPPYGVREGLRVLGCRDPEKTPWVVEAGYKRYKDPTFIPPKKPYSFLAMLDDILDFAVETLVNDGRLSFWMPTANDEAQEIPVPTHPCLEIVAVCIQTFNKWSRRLITYRRLADEVVDIAAITAWKARAESKLVGTTADELNPFRRGYFRKFQSEELTTDTALE